MHFLYIDESGNTGADLHCPQQPVFVMAGLLVSDEKWRKTQSAVQTRLSAFLGGALPHNFELHACELLSPNGDGPFVARPRNARNDLALELLNLIVERSHALFVVPIYKSSLAPCVAPQQDFGFGWAHPWQFGFEMMLTMFEDFLRGPDTGPSSTGLVIVDHEAQYVEFVRNHTNRRQRSGGWRQLRKVVEIGYSAASHANPLIQLTDLVAFTSRKYLELETPRAAFWPQVARDFFAQCKDSIWDRVKFKALSFKCLNVPASIIGHAKAIRKP